MTALLRIGLALVGLGSGLALLHFGLTSQALPRGEPLAPQSTGLAVAQRQRSNTLPTRLASVPEQGSHSGSRRDAARGRRGELEARLRQPVPATNAAAAIPVAAQPAKRRESGSSEASDYPNEVFEDLVAIGHYPNGAVEFFAHRIPDGTGGWRLHGPWQAWHDNGTKHELGAYRHDEEDGPWAWWYANGQMMAQGSFVNGERDGSWLFWHENGSVMMEGAYASGQGTGLWTTYHENGLKMAEGAYVDGEIGGFWTAWNDDGTLNHERTGRYEAGALVEQN